MIIDSYGMGYGLDILVEKYLLLLCILPGLVVYLLVVIFPSIAAFWFGFTKWDGFSPPQWVAVGVRFVVTSPSDSRGCPTTLLKFFA